MKIVQEFGVKLGPITSRQTASLAANSFII